MINIDEYLLLEQQVKDINVPTIYGVPIWKLVRTQFRWKYRNTRPFTVKPNIQIWEIVRNFFVSLIGITKLLLSRRKFDNVFFPHPRLFFVNGNYMERFSDSLIESAGIKDSSIILERHQNGIHKRPRYHSELVVYLDFIDDLARFLSPFTKILIKKKYSNQVHDLYLKLNMVFHLDDNSYNNLFYSIVSQFVILSWLIKPILKSISPQRVFFAPRGIFDYTVVFCKKNNIKTIELQHGIVIGKTDLYSGVYDPRIDPDFFFVFGKDNIGTQYAIPLDRVVNVGFPYKNYIHKINHVVLGEEVVLVVSEPGISEKIINVLIEIVKRYPEYFFHVRCHPQEKISNNLINRIKGNENIKVVDNKVESFVAISQYKTIIGEISSVLFEAMSLHKKVGRLNFGGLVSKETPQLHGGTIINSPEEFDLFMKSPYNDENDSKDLYSDFQPNALNVIGL